MKNILLLLLLVAAVSKAQLKIIAYVNDFEASTPTNTNNSYAYGVDPREYPYNKVDIWDWFATSPKSTPPYTTSGTYTKYAWADTIVSRAHQAGKKVVLDFGGNWGTNASVMSTIIADSVKTQIWADTCAFYAKKHNFDGGGINHEFPKSNEKDYVSRQIRILRRSLNKFIGTNALLIYTTARTHISACDPAVFAQNNVIIMTEHYGYGEWTTAGTNQFLGHNDPIYDSDCYPVKTQSWNTSGIKDWINNGYSNLGILASFESKGQTGVLCGTPNGAASFENYQKILNLGGAEYWDGISLVPYKYINGIFYKYNNTRSMKEKVRYTYQVHVGYFGIWSLPRGVLSNPPVGHTKFELLDSVYAEVQRGIPVIPPPPPITSCDTAYQRGLSDGYLQGIKYYKGLIPGTVTVSDTTIKLIKIKVPKP